MLATKAKFSSKPDALPVACMDEMSIVGVEEALPSRLARSVLLLGNFDMLHTGHRKLVDAARRIARRRNAPMAIMSCDPHPREFFQRSDAFLRIGTAESSRLAFAREGFDLLFRPRFDASFAAMSAASFMEDILAGQLDVGAVVCGGDFRFGQGRSGRLDDIRDFAAHRGIEVAVCDEVADAAGVPIRSSRIREAIACGDIGAAEALLGGHWYTSANCTRMGTVEFDGRQLLPPAGSYRVRLLDMDGNHIHDCVLRLDDEASRRLCDTPPPAAGNYIIVWLGHVRHPAWRA